MTATANKKKGEKKRGRPTHTPVTRLTQLIRAYFQVYFCHNRAPLHRRRCHTNTGLGSNWLAGYSRDSVSDRRPSKPAKYYWTRRSPASTTMFRGPFAVVVVANNRACAWHSQHVCTPGRRRDIPPLLLRRRHTCTYTQWLVCARLDLQGKALACMAAPIFLSAIENASRAHLREPEPGPEQQKTASHLKHAASSRQRWLSVKMHLGGCSLQTLACLSTSFSCALTFIAR